MKKDLFDITRLAQLALTPERIVQDEKILHYFKEHQTYFKPVLDEICCVMTEDITKNNLQFIMKYPVTKSLIVAPEQIAQQANIGPEINLYCDVIDFSKIVLDETKHALTVTQKTNYDLAQTVFANNPGPLKSLVDNSKDKSDLFNDLVVKFTHELSPSTDYDFVFKCLEFCKVNELLTVLCTNHVIAGIAGIQLFFSCYRTFISPGNPTVFWGNVLTILRTTLVNSHVLVKCVRLSINSFVKHHVRYTVTAIGLAGLYYQKNLLKDFSKYFGQTKIEKGTTWDPGFVARIEYYTPMLKESAEALGVFAQWFGANIVSIPVGVCAGAIKFTTKIIFSGYSKVN